MNGLIKTYSFDEKYFKVGTCYRLHKKSETNVYYNAILSNMTEDTLTFLKWDASTVTIRLSELYGYSHWEIYRLSEDYSGKGKFDSEE